MPCEAPSRCTVCTARELGFCGSFDDAQIIDLHRIGRHHVAQPGQVLIWAGDPATICATLVSGALKVVRSGADGREQIVGLLFPGDFVGDPFGGPAADSIVALAETRLCVYPRMPLEQLVASHPAAARELLQQALATLSEARRWILTLGRRQAAEKVAGFLLDMAGRAERQGMDPDRIELPLGRGAIGEVLGLTIETVSRQMTALKAAGLIALPGGRQVMLLDRDGLRARAG